MSQEAMLLLPEPELHSGILVTSKGEYVGTFDGYTPDQMRQAVETERVNFQRLMEKHNNLHMNAKADRDRIVALEKEIAQPSMDIIRATRKQPWVWLSPEEEQQIKDHCTTIACVLKAVKAKLKEKNNE